MQATASCPAVPGRVPAKAPPGSLIVRCQFRETPARVIAGVPPHVHFAECPARTRSTGMKFKALPYSSIAAVALRAARRFGPTTDRAANLSAATAQEPLIV
jgi:hypothetical protein